MSHAIGIGTTILKKNASTNGALRTTSSYVSDMVDPNRNTVTKKLWSYIKSKRHDNVVSTGLLSFQGEPSLTLLAM